MSFEDTADKICDRIPKMTLKEAGYFCNYLYEKHWDDSHDYAFYSEYIAHLPTETLKRDLEEWAEGKGEGTVEEEVQQKLERRTYYIKENYE